MNNFRMSSEGNFIPKKNHCMVIPHNHGFLCGLWNFALHSCLAWEFLSHSTFSAGLGFATAWPTWIGTDHATGSAILPIYRQNISKAPPTRSTGIPSILTQVLLFPMGGTGRAPFLAAAQVMWHNEFSSSFSAGNEVQFSGLFTWESWSCVLLFSNSCF